MRVKFKAGKAGVENIWNGFQKLTNKSKVLLKCCKPRKQRFNDLRSFK